MATIHIRKTTYFLQPLPYIKYKEIHSLYSNMFPSSSSSSSYFPETLNFKASSFHVNGGNGILFANMSPITRDDLRRIFDKLDNNDDGLVSLEDLNWLLQRIGSVQISLEELEPLVGKPCLNFDEFLFFYDSISNPPTTSDPPTSSDDDEEDSVVHGGDEDGDLAEAFKVFDLNGDGFISCEELENVLGRLGLWDKSSGKDCRTMIWFYDTNMDGVVDFQEFKQMMLHSINSTSHV